MQRFFTCLEIDITILSQKNGNLFSIFEFVVNFQKARFSPNPYFRPNKGAREGTPNSCPFNLLQMGWLHV